MFAPLAADATKGLGTGANDFDTGLAASGSTVVTSSIVHGNRLAPDSGRTFRQQIMEHALEAEDVEATVTALRSTFAIIYERIEGTSRPVVLLSADGASWRELPLTVGVLARALGR